MDNLLNIIPLFIRRKILFVLNAIAFFISVVTIASIIVEFGFVLDIGELQAIYKIYSLAWWIFFVLFLFRLYFSFYEIKGITLFFTLFIGFNLLITSFLKLFDFPESLQCINMVFGNKLYNIAMLAFFSVSEISGVFVGFINKRTNPALLMAVCFIIIIVIGAILLLLPRSTHEWIRLSVIDALFVSTSAVCVTGLSTVDIAQTFSFSGQCIIVVLIQIGGLGVMTITSFFALFFMGTPGILNQFALRDMIDSNTMSSFISTLFYIMGFTFVIEILGAFFIWLSIRNSLELEMSEELFFALFHAVSAFCNAGFSTLNGNLGNNLIISEHNSFFVIISLLILLGGIGFPILVNLKSMLLYYLLIVWSKIFEKDKTYHRYVHVVNINTKIVMVMTIALVFGATVMLALSEWNVAFAGMPFFDKIVHSFFYAIVPRTAGFNSVDLTSFSLSSILFYAFLMWIGGASQSTAGGIKVNTFAVALADFLSIVKGRKFVTLFNREITSSSVHRALAVIFGSLMVIFFFFVLLVLVEPDISAGSLLFETVSAYSTVGASLDVTTRLGVYGKILITILMFIGRVGLITVLMGFVRQKDLLKYRLPKGDVIIN